METDPRLYAPSVARNCQPITEILADILPDQGQILEIASGSGEHIVHFAQNFPQLNWTPSDPAPEKRASIDAWGDQIGDQASGQNLRPALNLNLSHSDWAPPKDLQTLQGICAINLIHIAPYAVCQNLISGAAKYLTKGGFLYLYGPYRIANQHISDSNQQFDLSLQQQNPDWGIRDMADIIALAHHAGLKLSKVIAMPNHNYSLLFEKNSVL